MCLHIHMYKDIVYDKNTNIIFILTYYIQCYNVSSLLDKMEVQVNILKSGKTSKERKCFRQKFPFSVETT